MDQISLMKPDGVIKTSRFTRESLRRYGSRKQNWVKFTQGRHKQKLLLSAVYRTGDEEAKRRQIKRHSNPTRTASIVGQKLCEALAVRANSFLIHFFLQRAVEVEWKVGGIVGELVGVERISCDTKLNSKI